MDNITKLTKVWCKIISLDHHKDRDCHFYINKVWSYGEESVYRVEHYGYIGDEIMSPDFLTYEEAEEYLEGKLRELISDEYEKARQIIEKKGESWWSSDQTKKAKEKVDEIKKIKQTINLKGVIHN